MERLLTILVVAFFFCLTTTITLAQEEGQPQPQSYVNPKIPCNSWDSISQALVTQYQEVPVAEGTSALTMQDDAVIGGELVFFVNKDTLTYSVVLHFEKEQMGCIVGAGEDFGPVGNKYLELYGAVKM